MAVVSLLFHDVFARDPGESGFVSAAADRYKLSLQEFDAQLRHLAEARNRSGFLITADDGGESYFTRVADRLEACGWRGRCFISTDYIGQPGFLNGAQIRELDARGHVIGSHSASHPARCSACPPDVMREEWRRSRRTLEDLLGRAVTAASVPGGYYSRMVAQTAADAGVSLLFTSEPTTREWMVDACRVTGRFAIRQGAAQDRAARLVRPLPRARIEEWVAWNAKGLVKPVLGSSYRRVADWVMSH